MKNNIKYILLAPVMGLTLAACQDSWDDHYGQQPDTTFGNQSLYEAMSKDGELTDFCKVLDATRMFANSKMSPTTYKELLSSDQVFTVWAPKNGTFDVDSLLNMCKTQNGDSLVETQFLCNHIARYSHADNGKSNIITLLNGKYLTMEQHKVNSLVDIDANKTNLTARNGVLHTISQPIAFSYNMYEKIVNLEKYSQIGNFFKSYHIDRFDESSSLPKGIVDGKTEYIDSVFYTYNYLWAWYGPIQSEDSSYLMIMPSKGIWEKLYAETKPYFDYSYISKDKNKCDSVSEFYTYDAILQDFLYNANSWKQKSIEDSVVSTNYYKVDPPEIQHHVFYKPYQPGGIFNLPGTTTDTCSNGIIYNVNTWPFTKEESFLQPIRVECEEPRKGIWRLVGKESGSNSDLNIVSENSIADSISGTGYLSITPSAAQDPYWVEYEIPGLLSCTYDIYLVVLPKSVNPTVDMTKKKSLRPNRFYAQISYTGRNGEEYTITCDTRANLDESLPNNYKESFSETVPYIMECNNDEGVSPRAFNNDPLAVDTVKLCTFKFPTCNYAQQQITNRIRISNAIEAVDIRKSNENMYLDCILLVPHNEESK